MLVSASADGWVRPAALAVALLCAAAPGDAQDHAHHGHGQAEDSAGWIMPPMDPRMPMAPGLETAVPPVRPFLPDPGADLSAFPLAEPSRTLDAGDGEVLDLAVGVARRRIHGRTYLMYAYNGQYPGPLIRAPRGATVTVRVTNAIDLPTTVHWHGIRLDNRFDGVPGVTQPPIAPGESFTYQVRVPDAGMFWYHPHVREDVQQDLGLYGNVMVLPALGEDEYGGMNQEQLLALDDLLLAEDGRLIPFGEERPTHALMGRFGNLILVNGETDLALEAGRGAVVRFFVTNVASARTFNVRFGGAAAVKLVGSDIGRYERERWVESIVIAPAERYVVDVAYEEAGTFAITNVIQAVDHFRGEFYPHVDTLAVIRVRTEPVAESHLERFRTLGVSEAVVAEIDRFRPHFDRAPDHELVTTLRVHDLPPAITQMMAADTFYAPPVEWNDAMPMMNWLSTGGQVTWVLRDRNSGKENAEIDWTVRQGDIVKIRIFNDPESLHPMNHPIHVHGQRFLVIARDGVLQQNLVWKDTALLPVGSTMDLLVDMSNPGEWMLHCHIAEHMHSGMMFHFDVESTDGA